MSVTNYPNDGSTYQQLVLYNFPSLHPNFASKFSTILN